MGKIGGYVINHFSFDGDHLLIVFSFLSCCFCLQDLLVTLKLRTPQLMTFSRRNCWGCLLACHCQKTELNSSSYVTFLCNFTAYLFLFLFIFCWCIKNLLKNFGPLQKYMPLFFLVLSKERMKFALQAWIGDIHIHRRGQLFPSCQCAHGQVTAACKYGDLWWLILFEASKDARAFECTWD